MAANQADFSLQPDGSSQTGSGAGIPGVLVDGVFWYWQSEVSAASLKRDQSRITAKVIEKYAAICLSLVLMMAFILGVVLVDQAQPTSWDFWSTPSWSAASFYLAISTSLFGVYRHLSGQRSLSPLAGVGKLTAPELVYIPSLASVERKRDIAGVVSQDSELAVAEAYRLAVKSGHAEVGVLHLFAGALATPPVQIVLARLGIPFDELKDPLRRRLATQSAGNTVFGAQAQELLAQALLLALENGRPRVSALDILATTFAAEPFLTDLFESKGIAPDELANALAWMRISEDLTARYRAFRRAAVYKPTGSMNRSMTAVATPFLDAVSYDLTRAAVQGQTGLLVGRDTEVQTILRAIEGGGQSVVLVGQSGVGKQALVEGIADLMVEEKVPMILQDKRLLQLSVPHIVSAQGGNGADERFLFALEQVARAGNIVLVIENIHELVGQAGGFDLASILASELGRGYTFVIATTTPQGYAEIIERSVIAPKLQKIVINELDRNESIRVLESKVGGIEAKHKVIFTYGALAAAVDLSSRYMHDGALPEKAIEVIRETALVVSKRGELHAWVKKADVAALISERTRIPVTEVSTGEGEKLLHLEERVHERVIGQEQAVTAVAAALRRARTELRSGKRPIANFLFLGPTGVGKTELAKATAEVYFGNEQAMVRFDMSEYQEQSAITRLIGGNGQAGLMTEAVRKNPFCLLLLDELEKAHPDILNLFLQVMDDGRLTDGLGRTVDFTNIILIATSNAGTQFIQDQVEAGAAISAIKTELMERELKTIYRPEFLNRFDDVIVFTPLTREDVVAIAYLSLAKVTERLKAKGITFSVTDAAVHELAEQGYDPKFGARPLRRVIQEKVENQLADFLLKGSVGRRDSLVFDAGGVITLNKAEEL
ncbi:MAG: ATP-dependent Clp protease ATP-binding subunit [Patescibacteria group bacterium]